MRLYFIDFKALSSLEASIGVTVSVNIPAPSIRITSYCLWVLARSNAEEKIKYIMKA